MILVLHQAAFSQPNTLGVRFRKNNKLYVVFSEKNLYRALNDINLLQWAQRLLKMLIATY